MSVTIWWNICIWIRHCESYLKNKKFYHFHNFLLETPSEHNKIMTRRRSDLRLRNIVGGFFSDSVDSAIYMNTLTVIFYRHLDLQDHDHYWPQLCDSVHDILFLSPKVPNTSIPVVMINFEVFILILTISLFDLVTLISCNQFNGQ